MKMGMGVGTNRRGQPSDRLVVPRRRAVHQAVIPQADRHPVAQRDAVLAPRQRRPVKNGQSCFARDLEGGEDAAAHWDGGDHVPARVHGGGQSGGKGERRDW